MNSTSQSFGLTSGKRICLLCEEETPKYLCWEVDLLHFAINIILLQYCFVLSLLSALIAIYCS